MKGEIWRGLTRAASGGTPGTAPVDAPASPLIATAAIAVVTTVVLLPVGSHQLAPSVSFLTAVLAVVACLDVLSIYLLVATYRDSGDLRVLVMSCAYVFSMVAMIGYAMAFPGAVALDPPLAVTASMAPYLYIAWHGGFPILLGVAWGPWPARWRGIAPCSATPSCASWPCSASSRPAPGARPPSSGRC